MDIVHPFEKKCLRDINFRILIKSLQSIQTILFQYFLYLIIRRTLWTMYVFVKQLGHKRVNFHKIWMVKNYPIRWQRFCLTRKFKNKFEMVIIMAMFVYIIYIFIIFINISVAIHVPMAKHQNISNKFDWNSPSRKYQKCLWNMFR